MANIKQQKKRILTNEKRHQRNISFKSSTKTALKNLEKAVAEKNLENSTKFLALAFKKLDKGLAKGIFHKNYVARHKSRISSLVNSVSL
ncbi:MAG: 30S ribosomal protein S20 [Acholeplasmatales bacterium]|jgi:small subunit ribosomal protein S20|nr:30S ribosomal protein S20 [Acholeplasmatales bacterium]